MKRTLSSELAHCLDEPVMLRGWLNNLRAFGKLNFLILRDRAGLVQVVIESKEELQKIAHLHPGSVLRIKGKVVASAQAGLGVEIINPTIEVESAVLEPPLLEYYKPEMQADLDFILDHRSIALRNRQIQTVFRMQADIAHAYRLYMHDVVGAFEYFSPNLLGTSSEGGAEFFNVDYFGYPATLAQSSQLYKQIMVGVNERVFAIAPFFRAEPSMTSRHIAEGKQFEFEMGFFEHWHEILDIQEACIKYIVNYLVERYPGQIPIRAPENVPFPRLTFFEAQELYYKRTGIDERHEPDLSPAAERELCRYAAEEFGTDLVFITDWKTQKRPFYAFPNENNQELTNTFDLLCAGTEITSGGQRRHTYDSMVEGILLKEMDPASFEDYLSIFKFGMPPHGGFGMGLERLTMTLLKLKNIREASLFPSDPKRIAGTRLKAKIIFGKENIRNEILHLLRDRGFEFDHKTHEETPTSEDSARVRGTKLEEGIKAIILRGKNSKKNYQVNIPSHLKVDMKAVAARVGERCEFEAPEVIEERYGLQVGGIPPFGNLLNIETFFDATIATLNTVAFNCGLRTESIVMKAADLIAIVNPELGAFAI
jgi:nondiscriminating aspartyl-tRNA synthetase